jgi:hypothetical protein
VCACWSIPSVNLRQKWSDHPEIEANYGVSRSSYTGRMAPACKSFCFSQRLRREFTTFENGKKFLAIFPNPDKLLQLNYSFRDCLMNRPSSVKSFNSGGLFMIFLMFILCAYKYKIDHGEK